MISETIERDKVQKLYNLRYIKKEDLGIKLLVPVLLLLSIGQYFGIASLNLLMSAVVAGLFVLSRVDKCLIMLFAALPFFNFFNANTGSTSLYYIYVGIFLLKFFSNFGIGIDKILFLLATFIVRIPGDNLSMLIRWVAMFTVLIVLDKEELFYKNIVEIIDRMSNSLIFSLAVAFIMLIQGKSIYTNAYIYNSDGTITTRFAGLVGDSVFCAQFIAIIISALLCIALNNERYLVKNTVKTAILSVFCIFTYAKTGIVLVVVLLIAFAFLYIAYNFSSKRTVHRSLVGFTVLIILSVVAINYVITHMDNPVIAKYVLRFTSNDLMTGRNVIFDHYYEILISRVSSLFVSMPMSLYFEEFYGGAIYLSRTHNIYLETVCAFGLCMSVILFLCIFVKVVRYFQFPNQKKLSGILPLAVLLATGFVLHGHFESQYYYLVSIALIFVYPNTILTIQNSEDQKEGVCE